MTDYPPMTIEDSWHWVTSQVLDYGRVELGDQPEALRAIREFALTVLEEVDRAEGADDIRQRIESLPLRYIRGGPESSA